MEILTVLFYVYLALGTVYGLYLLIIGSSSIWQLPINILGGPVMFVYIVIKTLREDPYRKR
jgi:hypothetical protein